MKLRMILAAAALAATPATAADFTGLRAQFQAGYDSISVADSDFGIDDSRDGLLYGVGIGYDFALGTNLVLGVETNIDWTTADFEVTNGPNRAAIDPGRDISAVARLGFKAGESYLVYGLAGYTNLRVTGEATLAGTSFNEAANGDGFRIGAGLERALGEKGFVKVEYRYSDYEGDVSRHQVLAGAGIRF